MSDAGVALIVESTEGNIDGARHLCEFYWRREWKSEDDLNGKTISKLKSLDKARVPQEELIYIKT
jgi:hypothetical protein